MKAKELRIGNYILHEPTIDDWEEIIVTLPSLLQVDISPESYCGIPLTEEWLLKFGFEKDTYASTNRWILYNHDEGEVLFEISGSDSYGWVRIFTTTNGIEDTDTHFKYVHQLQNLYFALTGEELTLKEKQDA